jgi:hypothetical protein
MPPIRIIEKKENEIKDDFSDIHLKNIFDESNLFENNTNKNKNPSLNFFDVYIAGEKLSREEVLEQTKLNIIYKGSNHHPSTRTQFGMTYDLQGRIFIYGGLGGKKLGDLWECDLTNKFSWRKIYTSQDKETPFGEPNPRYGNTIHYYKEKLYNIGGSFLNWETNDNSEGILCIYDLTLKLEYVIVTRINKKKRRRTKK